MAAGDLAQRAGQHIAVAHFDNLAFHDGRALAASLRAHSLDLPEAQRWNTVPLSIPFFGRKKDGALSATQAARLLDDALAIKALAQALNEAVGQAGAVDLLLMPAILGLDAHRQRLFDLQALTGLPIAELAAMTPSVPGLRLQKALRQGLQSYGVEQIRARLRALDWSDPQNLRGEMVDANGRTEQILSQKIVLATGHLAAGGLRVDDGSGLVRENIADLPLFLDGRRLAERKAGHLLQAQRHESQPLMRVGLACNNKLQVLVDDDKNIINSNIYTAGAVIAGNDPVQDKAGLGLAALTGYLAGLQAAKEN